MSRWIRFRGGFSFLMIQKELCTFFHIDHIQDQFYYENVQYILNSVILVFLLYFYFIGYNQDTLEYRK